MATNPLPGSTFTFSIPLDDLANAGLFKAAPTIAAGDFKRSINNGALTNMDNLPAVTPAGGKLVQFVLSADETTAAGDGGTIDVVGSDASGAEWGDVTVHVRVGTASANVTYSAGVALTGRLAEVTDLPAAAPSAAAVADAVWDEAISGHLTAGTTGAKLNTASSASGAGSTAYTNTITDTGSNPLDGVEVWITSDSGGASTVASTTTDTLGAFTVYLDPGTYYLWLAKGGYNFGNPTTITVS